MEACCVLAVMQGWMGLGPRLQMREVSGGSEMTVQVAVRLECGQSPVET